MIRDTLPPLPVADPFEYQCGFGNYFSSGVPACLPDLGYSPRRCAENLYAELISGTPQTTMRTENQCTWVYRRRPSVAVLRWLEFGDDQPFPELVSPLVGGPCAAPLMWKPPPTPALPVNFLAGMRRLGGGGDAALRTGYNIYQFRFNARMDKCAYCSGDGSVLLIPCAVGPLGEGSRAFVVETEMGCLMLQPREVCVIPRGICFAVHAAGEDGSQGWCSGFAVEVMDGLFTLPAQGVVGSSGLANVRDFQYPVAREANGSASVQGTTDRCDGSGEFTVFHKLCETLHGRVYGSSSIFDVAAWQGNYSPFKYDLLKFCAVNTVTYDHMDPCIGTVLSVLHDGSGTSSVDFAVFVPQRRVAVDTFRPPNLHRNCMAEVLGVVSGSYDARPKLLAPGGATLHNLMTPHGPFPDVLERHAATGTNAVEEPVHGSLSFLLEARLPMRLTQIGAHAEGQERSYALAWQQMSRR
jgi:homogentisate 1,2-dioxygenase